MERVGYMCVCMLCISMVEACVYVCVCVCVTRGEDWASQGQPKGLENPRDGGARWAAVSGVAQSRTRLKRLSSSSSSSRLLEWWQRPGTRP